MSFSLKGMQSLTTFQSQAPTPARLTFKAQFCRPASNFRKVSRFNRYQLSVCSSEAPKSLTETVRAIQLPEGPEETVKQATAAVNRAIADNIKLMDVEFLLPLIGATDLDDWPGGVRQQFQVAQPMVNDILKGLPTVETKGMKLEILDQSDAIALWDGSDLATVLFPTAETVDDLMSIAKKDTNRPLMVVNTQWNQGGQIISDFGWGPFKSKREGFVKSLTPVYALKATRVLGESVRILYSYPGEWQIFAIAPDGVIEPIKTCAEEPSYKELEEMLKAREGSIANQSVGERLVSEFKFNRDTLKAPDNFEK